jgi:hypothetical protein
VHAAGVPTVKSTSLEGSLVADAVAARTRIAYLPGGTWVAANRGRADPVFTLARLLSPLAEPASSTYEVGALPAGGVHARITRRADTCAFNAVGGPESRGAVTGITRSSGAGETDGAESGEMPQPDVASAS